MDKLENQEDDYENCESPKAKRHFIESQDAKMHKKHKSSSESQKSIPMPSSPCHSSPSSTSSISSTLNIHQQKQLISDQCYNNGSSEYISKLNVAIYSYFIRISHFSFNTVEDLSGNLQNLSHGQKAQQMRENSILQNLNQRPGSLGSLGGNHSNLLSSGLPQMSMGLAQSPQMPQLVLANGHLSQGIQGAQVLIPTAQGKIYSIT
jgi:hypothetical protein